MIYLLFVGSKKELHDRLYCRCHFLRDFVIIIFIFIIFALLLWKKNEVANNIYCLYLPELFLEAESVMKLRAG